MSEWKPRILNAETVICEERLDGEVVVRLHCHFGQYDMAHFERMSRLHPTVRFTYDKEI